MIKYIKKFNAVSLAYYLKLYLFILPINSEIIINNHYLSPQSPFRTNQSDNDNSSDIKSRNRIDYEKVTKEIWNYLYNGRPIKLLSGTLSTDDIRLIINYYNILNNNILSKEPKVPDYIVYTIIKALCNNNYIFTDKLTKPYRYQVTNEYFEYVSSEYSTGKLTNNKIYKQQMESEQVKHSIISKPIETTISPTQFKPFVLNINGDEIKVFCAKQKNFVNENFFNQLYLYNIEKKLTQFLNLKNSNAFYFDDHYPQAIKHIYRIAIIRISNTDVKLYFRYFDKEKTILIVALWKDNTDKVNFMDYIQNRFVKNEENPISLEQIINYKKNIIEQLYIKTTEDNNLQLVYTSS